MPQVNEMVTLYIQNKHKKVCEFIHFISVVVKIVVTSVRFKRDLFHRKHSFRAKICVYFIEYPIQNCPLYRDSLVRNSPSILCVSVHFMEVSALQCVRLRRFHCTTTLLFKYFQLISRILRLIYCKYLLNGSTENLRIQ